MTSFLFALGTVLLTVTVPFFVLAMYRLLVFLALSLCGTTITGTVVSRQPSMVHSCLHRNSTHRMDSNNQNIEVWVVYRHGFQFQPQTAMFEVPSSRYQAYPRGKQMQVQYCRMCCCLRAQPTLPPTLTCRRCCVTLACDRFLDLFLVAVVGGGCICVWYGRRGAAELGVLSVIPVLTCLCLGFCCGCNICFLRKNTYPQHLAEVIATDCDTLLDAFVEQGESESDFQDLEQMEQKCRSSRSVELVMMSSETDKDSVASCHSNGSTSSSVTSSSDGRNHFTSLGSLEA